MQWIKEITLTPLHKMIILAVALGAACVITEIAYRNQKSITISKGTATVLLTIAVATWLPITKTKGVISCPI